MVSCVLLPRSSFVGILNLKAPRRPMLVWYLKYFDRTCFGLLGAPEGSWLSRYFGPPLSGEAYEPASSEASYAASAMGWRIIPSLLMSGAQMPLRPHQQPPQLPGKVPRNPTNSRPWKH